MRSSSNPKLHLIGGLLAGIGASACCLGPLLLLSLGIGEAWIGSLTALEPVRPIFIALVVLFLALAFRRLYLAPPTCAPGTGCAVSNGTQPDKTALHRTLFWIVALFALSLIAAPWVLPFFYR